MRDLMNDNNETAEQSSPVRVPSNTPTTAPSVTHDETPSVQPDANHMRTEIYRPTQPKILYNTLLDDSPIKSRTARNPATDTVHTTPNDTLLNSPSIDHTLLNGSWPNDPATDRLTSKPLDGEPQLVKHYAHEIISDNQIMAESHQLTPSDDRLEDDSNATGQVIEQLGVSLKQWQLTLSWQRTNVAKAGLVNRLKKRTEILDIDLSCLLCNRYGEVLESVWFKQVRDQAECIRHHGDELLGIKPALPNNIEAIGNDSAPIDTSVYAYQDRQANQERVSLYLNRIPTHVFHVVMLVSNYRGHHLAQAQQGLCQLTDDEGNLITELNLETLPSDCAALWLATLTRSGDSWRFNADKRPLTGHQHDVLLKQVHDHLVRTAK